MIHIHLPMTTTPKLAVSFGGATHPNRRGKITNRIYLVIISFILVILTD